MKVINLKASTSAVIYFSWQRVRSHAPRRARKPRTGMGRARRGPIPLWTPAAGTQSAPRQQWNRRQGAHVWSIVDSLQRVCTPCRRKAESRAVRCLFVTGVGAPVQVQRAAALRFFSTFLGGKKGTACRGVSDKKLIRRANLLNKKR